ncbi:MAG: DUF2971 domain-containing protein [Rhodocyclaceae bacterium]|nr:DUF2971 domain-containing protein [Rhodocyclaceae bacterium]
MSQPRVATATNLFRIVSFDRAAEIITSRKLYFAHPSTWEDPYENALKHSHAKAIFAQCWCRKAVSDAMWRIYSPHGLGVQIATTRQRLRTILQVAVASRRPNLSFAILNVTYHAQTEIDARLEEARKELQTEFNLDSLIQPLFFKRKAFDHEREARVVIFDKTCLEGDQKRGIALDVDPFKLLTSVWIDPRAPDESVKAYTYYLKEKLGFPGTVAKSRLYATPASEA